MDVSAPRGAAPPAAQGGGGGGGGGGGDRRGGLIAVNDLTYVLEPDLSVAVNKTHKKHYFQSNSYVAGQRGICILNSGADYIDTRRSYLSFDFELKSPADTRAVFGDHGSACNLIKTVTISTRSGDELCRISEFPLLCNMMLPLKYSKDWLSCAGGAMGFDKEVNVNKVTRFVIPMYILSPLFGYGRLLPAMLMSGLRIELEFNTSEAAFQTHTGLVKPDGEDTRPTLFSPPGTFEISNTAFNLCSVQLSDSIQRALNEQSATNGLEIVYTDWDRTAHSDGASSLAPKKLHLEVRKSCSRALKAFARVRCSVTGSNTNHAVNKVKRLPAYVDSYRSESGFQFLEWQWQLGSLYFPQQPVKTPTQDPARIGCETYFHLLDAVDKATPSATPPALRWDSTDLQSATDGRLLWQKSNPQRWTTAIPYVASPGTFMNGGTTIGVNLERSTMFNLAGVPINNSRVLALRGEMQGTLYEDLSGGTPTRELTIFLKYVKLARVFLNNTEVEQ